MSDQLRRLDQGSKSIIRSFLPMSDHLAVRTLARHTYCPIELTTLLNSIAHGNQSRAAEILNVNPKLALYRGIITDYSGRTFESISAVEYAAWARDHHILKMITDNIELIPETEIKLKLVTDMLKQFNEVTERFSLKPLIEAYCNYIYVRGIADSALADAALLELGMQQYGLPANVAQHYCDPGLAFYTSPNFDFRTAIFNRNLTFNYIPTCSDEHWFESCLGSDLVILRGGSDNNATALGRGVHLGGSAMESIMIDLAAIEALDVTRTMEVLEINSYLTKLKLYLEESMAVAAQPIPQRPAI